MKGNAAFHSLILSNHSLRGNAVSGSKGMRAATVSKTSPVTEIVEFTTLLMFLG